MHKRKSSQRRTKWAIHSKNLTTGKASFINVIARTKITAANKFHRMKPLSTITSMHKKKR